MSIANTASEGIRTRPREPRRDSRRRRRRVRAARPAAGSAEDLQHARLPGGRAVRAVRQRADGGGGMERRSTCARCGADLHTCAQCANFDTGAPFECQKPMPRASPRRTRATPVRFEPRTTVERETKSAAPPSARKAFDNLFK